MPKVAAATQWDLDIRVVAGAVRGGPPVTEVQRLRAQARAEITQPKAKQLEPTVNLQVLANVAKNLVARLAKVAR